MGVYLRKGASGIGRWLVISAENSAVAHDLYVEDNKNYPVIYADRSYKENSNKLFPRTELTVDEIQKVLEFTAELVESRKKEEKRKELVETLREAVDKLPLETLEKLAEDYKKYKDGVMGAPR